MQLIKPLLSLHKQNNKTMTNFNKTLTLKEAQTLINQNSMSYVNTEHNKKMIAKAIDMFLLTLRPATN